MKDYGVKLLFSLGLTLCILGLVLTPTGSLWADAGDSPGCTGCNACGNAVLDPNNLPNYKCNGVFGGNPYCSTTGENCVWCAGGCQTYSIEDNGFVTIKCRCTLRPPAD